MNLLLLFLVFVLARGQDGPVCPRIRVPTSLDQKDDEILLKRRAELCVISCEDDNDCNSQEKCCPTSCGGKLCVGPVPEIVKSGTCPPMGEKVFACKKIGDSCTGDASCPFNYKCCPGYCGHVCVEPIKETSVQSSGQDYSADYSDYYSANVDSFGADKSGNCPPETLADRLARVVCKTDCISDSQCPGDQKCCKKGCSQRCLQPTRRGKPTTRVIAPGGGTRNLPRGSSKGLEKSSKKGCPPSPGAIFSNLYCSNECLDDFMCAPTELCCPVGRCFVCTKRIRSRA